MTSRNDKTPQYLIVRDNLAAQIETGELLANTKLPSERELSEQFSTSRVTAREALLQLESEGHIYRLNRRGWFVSPPRIQYDPTKSESFIEYVSAQSGNPETFILSATSIKASRWIANHLDIMKGDEVYLITRCRHIDQRPVLVENIYVNAKLCPDLLDIQLNRSLTEIQQRFYNIEISRTQIQMYPAALAEAHANELHVAPGTPGLYVMRTNYDQHGNIVDYDQEFWRHDVLEISLDVSMQ